jgi:hypothetical protein
VQEKRQAGQGEQEKATGLVAITSARCATTPKTVSTNWSFRHSGWSYRWDLVLWDPTIVVGPRPFRLQVLAAQVLLHLLDVSSHALTASVGEEVIVLHSRAPVPSCTVR